MTFEQLIGLGVSIALTVYLVYALVKAERF